MGNDTFNIGLIASLDTSKSKQQLNKDIENLQKNLHSLDVSVGFDENQIKNVQNQLSKLKFEINTVNISQQALNNLVNQINGALQNIKLPNNIVNQSSKSSQQNRNSSFNDSQKTYKDLLETSRLLNSLQSRQVKLSPNSNSQEWKTLSKEIDEVSAKYNGLWTEFFNKPQNLEIFKMEDLTRLKELGYTLEQTKAKMQDLQNSKINNISEKVYGGTKNDYGTQITNLQGNFKSLGLSEEEALNKTQNISNAIQILKTELGKPIESQSFENIITAFENVQKELAETSNEYSKLKVSAKGMATEQQRLALANTIESWNQKNTKATKQTIEQNNKYIASLRNLGSAINTVEFNKIKTGFQQAENSMRSIGRLGASLKDQMNQAFTSFSQWLSVSSAVMMFVSKTREAVTEIKEVDTILTEISKTSNLTSAELKSLGKDSFGSASKYGKNATDYLTGIQEMYRAGFKNAKDMAELSVLTQSAGDVSVDVANDYLIATDAAYDYKGSVEKLNEVLDGQNYITNNSAVSMSDMASATKEAASVASQYGVKVEQLSSLIAVAVSKTRQSGSEAGNAIKSLFINLQDTTSKPIREAFESVGISMTKIVNGSKQLKNPIELLKELSVAFNSLPEGDEKRANILTDIGKKYHANTLAAILGDWDSYEKMLNLYSQGDGSALSEAEKSANNLQGSLNKLNNTWTDTVNNIANSDVLKGTVNVFNNLLSAVNSVTDAFGSAGSIGLGIGLLTGLKNNGFIKTETDDFGRLGIKGNNPFSGLFSGDFFKKKSVLSDEDISALEAYNNRIDQSYNAQSAFDLELKKASPIAQNYAKAAIESAKGMDNLSEKAKASKVNIENVATTSKAATVGLKALSVIGNIALNVLASIAISAIISGIDKLVHAQENAIKKAEETLSAFNETRESLQNNKKTVDSVASDYQKLSTGVDEFGRNVSLTTTEYDRYNEIANQIGEMFPQLIQGWTDEGNAIIKNKGNVEELTKAYEEQKKAYKDNLIIQSDDVYKGFSEKVNKKQFFPWDKWGDSEQIDFLKKLQGSLENYDEFKEYFNNLSKEEQYDFTSKLHDSLGIFTWLGKGNSKTNFDKIKELEYKIPSLINSLASSVNAETAKIRPITEALVENSDDYQKLDEKAQEIVKRVINSFDSEFYKNHSPEQARSWVEDNLLPELQGENGVKIIETFEMKTKFNNGEISIPEYRKQLNDFLAIIDKLPDETKKQILIAFGYNVASDGSKLSDFDNIEKRYKTNIEKARKKFGEKPEGFDDDFDWDSWFASFHDNSDSAVDDFGNIIDSSSSAGEAIQQFADRTKNAVDLSKMSIEDLSKDIDDLQKIYKTVSSAISEFNNTGYLSVDSFQALMELDAKYIPMLIDEQGNLTLTKEALNDLTAARMEEMAIKQAQALIDSVSSLGTEAEQMSLLRGQVDQTTNSFKEFAEAQALALLASGKISANVYNELIVKLNAIGTTLENAKQGLKNGGWDSKNLENVKKKAEKAKELAEKEKEIQEDLAKKEKEIQEDLAEKEKQFAENMAESVKKEHLEQLKDDLNKQKDLIDRFHKAVELTDFAIGYIDDDNFQLKSDLLAGKMNNLTTYGKSMREEFDRICQIIPQTGEEAEALASRIEQLGSDMRSNISDIRETQVAIQTLRIDAFQSIADNSMAELEKELDNIDRRLELLNVDNKNDYKYTNELLSMNSLLPVYSDFNKTRKEKSKQDKQKIEDEQKTQDKINEVVSNALKMQAEDNAKAREKERKKLIEDMEKARKDAMEKLEEARKDAQKKLQEARKNYQDFLNGIKADTTATLDTISKDIEGRKYKLQPIDATEFTKSIEDAKNKLEDLFANPLYDAVNAVNNKGYMNPLSNGSISSTFGYRKSTNSNHQGIDIAAQSGTVISAIKGGTVSASGNANDGYGNKVVVVTPDGMEIIYAHMLKPSSLKVGDTVSIGDKIGEVGSTGRSTGAHLHLGMKKMGQWVNPSNYIPGYASGTEYSQSGKALLGEDGFELVETPNGIVHIVGQNGMTLADLPEGSKVIPHEEAQKLLDNPENFNNILAQHQTDIKGRNEYVNKQEVADITFMRDNFSSGFGKITSDIRLRQQEIIDSVTLSDEDKQKALVSLAVEAKNEAGEFAVEFSKAASEGFKNYLKRVKDDPTLFSEETVSEWQSLLSDTTDWVYDFENDIVQKKQTLVENTQNKVSDIDDYIETRDFHNDWSLWNDSKEDSMLRQIGEWKKLLDDGYISVEEYNKQIQDIEKNLYTIKKDKLVEALELNLSKMKSLQSITQSYFDTTNSIAEAQHNITKELEASKTMTEYLDEDTRKLLFNQDDYNKLTKTLTNIQSEANRLQKEFNKKIRHASAEEMDALTSEYQMQYDILMKKYEISKADLEIEKKRTQLNNVLNERNVRMRINGKWQYVANTQDVINAQNELSEAEYQKTQASTSLSQTREINNMTLAQDKTTTIINQINKGLVDFDKDVSKFKSGINDLHTKSVPAFGTMISNCCASLKQFKRGLDGIETPISTSDNYDYSSGAQNGVSSVGLKSNQLTYTLKDRDTKANRQFYILPYDKNIDYANLIDNAKTLDEALNYNNYRNSKIRDIKGGEDYENEKQWDSNYVKDRWLANRKKYAKGTRKTHTETALMGEKEFELFINSHGNFIPITQPTIGNIKSGGLVFNEEQLNNARKIWDLVNIGGINGSENIYNKANNNIQNINYNMYGDAVFNGDNPEAMWKGMSGYMKHTRYKSN